MTHSNQILLVEDDPDAREGLTEILEMEGFDVTTVGSFGEAIAATNRQRFAVLICDRRLPDGLVDDRLSELKAQATDAEVLVVTGFGDIQSTIDAFRKGVSDYVMKPIQPDELIRTVRRITEKRRLELRLRKEHAFTDKVLATAEAIVLVLDKQGRVVRFNPYFEQLTNWKLADLAGKDWFDHCIADPERERVREVFEETASGQSTRGVINSVIGRNGETFQIRWSNSKLNDESYGEAQMLAIGVDVTDVTEANERALRSERLAAIGETMAALAHESRNALQRIQAAAEVLAMEIEGNADAEEDLDAIRRAGSDLQCLLESVRSFAAPIQMALQTVDLAEIWRQAWHDLIPLRDGRDARLIEIVGSCDHVAPVDVVRMEQVFRNLFINSLEAGTDPVEIKITCQCTTDFVDLRVQDNGPGLNSDQASHLFEPFFTTKATGTGLGMPICQRIIDAHRGRIFTDHQTERQATGQATDRPVVGASFRIQLPRLATNRESGAIDLPSRQAETREQANP